MTQLKFDETGSRKFEAGVDHAVLYVVDKVTKKYGKGVAWNGITTITESPSGADVTSLYADNVKYLNLRAAEDFGATIEAYTYPQEFEVCDGSAQLAPGVVIGQQGRATFGLVYRTKLGNDVSGSDLGFKLHVVYGATASPTEKEYGTINDSPDAVNPSWEIATTPVSVPGFLPTSVLTIDSTIVDPAKFKAVIDKLYGTDEPAGEPTFLMPNEIAALVGA